MPTTTGPITGNSGVITHYFGPRDTICRIATGGTFSSISYALTASMDSYTAGVTTPTNYAPIACIDLSTYSDDNDGAFATQSAGKILEIPCAMLTGLKLTSSAYSSGTMSVVISSCPDFPNTVIAGG